MLVDSNWLVFAAFFTVLHLNVRSLCVFRRAGATPFFVTRSALTYDIDAAGRGEQTFS